MPELELGDAGQSPFRIDVNHVPVRGREVAMQIELDAVHPFHIGGERAEVLKRWGRRASMSALTNGAIFSIGSAAI